MKQQKLFEKKCEVSKSDLANLEILKEDLRKLAFMTSVVSRIRNGRNLYLSVKFCSYHVDWRQSRVNIIMKEIRRKILEYFPNVYVTSWGMEDGTFRLNPI